ncbi:MAG: TIGR00341 family protein [Gammaproteobacteria bacterium]|nr:TIGR00341 family protein [Gammaproteobacteria bacterium]
MSVTDSQSQWQETVRVNIREDASFSKAHLLMNALAATIASYGLFANSPAVVIGAMIVAMLLGPIVGVSLALVDSDAKILLKSVLSLLSGTVAVLATAFIIGVLHNDIPLTSEIMVRTAPNFLDLMIALAGGAAGAYATVSFRLSMALVGVAIATALVPPMSSAGILLARGDFSLAMGALELAVVNLVAIQFSASVVLWLTGFRRVTSASGQPIAKFLRQNLLSILILAVLGVSLSVNSRHAIAKQLFETKTQFSLQQEINSSLGSHVTGVRFEKVPGKTIVRAVVRGPNPPSAAQVAAMEDQLPSSPDGTAVTLRIRYVQVMIIDRDGLLYSDIAFGSDE